MKKKKLIMGIILIMIVCIAIGAVVFYKGTYQTTSSARLADEYKNTIETFISSVDFDNDGIDDQTDILEGAIAYIQTEPKYKSKYYNTGYPDDEYGVCTDVVAFALLNAGYDLMELVQEDIAANPEDYDIDEPDANIDFRRVKNLKVYFANTAIELTTDIYDVEEWQGGDIVIFENHIGIVSDKRNEDGVTYVIHHNSASQTSYEEDILEERDDIVAHYRISE